ncbi:MAG: hypothetical protein NTY53_01470, partial [Kiritimatiellaeota bacterium]|nr:hypothetical protein [Kiritimatiellota bacterium]
MNHTIIRSIGVQMVSLGKQQAELAKQALALKCALIKELEYASPCTEEGRELERLAQDLMAVQPFGYLAEKLANFGQAQPEPLPQAAQEHHGLLKGAT